MGSRDEHRLRAYLNRPLPDEPDAWERVLEGTPPPGLPRWAVHALRRGDQIEGKWVSMPERWYSTCPKCLQDVFLIHPYIPPALEEIVLPGAVQDNRGSLDDPVNDIRIHPCTVEWREIAWEDLSVNSLNKLME